MTGKYKVLNQFKERIFSFLRKKESLNCLGISFTFMGTEVLLVLAQNLPYYHSCSDLINYVIDYPFEFPLILSSSKCLSPHSNFASTGY
jgi:hypothetical protein